VGCIDNLATLPAIHLATACTSADVLSPCASNWASPTLSEKTAVDAQGVPCGCELLEERITYYGDFRFDCLFESSFV
jgi:hypothetical protein